MDPNFEEIENKAPTPQGTLLLRPTACSQRIASFYGLPKTAIATVSVPSTTVQLYNAVSEYAALVPSQHKSPITPLFISSLDPFESCVKKESTYDSDEDDGGNQTNINRPHLEPPPAPTINFKWDLGETTVVWPPPPNLEAKRLAEQKKNQSRAPKPVSVISTVAMDNTEGKEAMQSIDKNDLIYLVHYSMQQYSSQRSDPRVILMASPKAAKLCKFAQEVLQWHMDKNHVAPESSEYRLHRFKSEGECGWWDTQGMKRARPPKSVILHENQMDDIICDVKEFLSHSTQKWYVDHGLPYRRCFLFYGPPGTGKTSTVRAIASHFGMSCYFLNMTNSSFSNQKLADAFSGIPSQNSLLVLEDVDSLFNEDRKSQASDSLTFSGLLNALDGLLSADGVLTVMTTNHIKRLDEALIRAGRVDRKFFFGHPSELQIEKLFLTFYPDTPSEVSKGFAKAVVERPAEEKSQNFATLQELFVSCRKKTAEECVREVSTFFKNALAYEK